LSAPSCAALRCAVQAWIDPAYGTVVLASTVVLVDPTASQYLIVCVGCQSFWAGLAQFVLENRPAPAADGRQQPLQAPETLPAAPCGPSTP